MVPAAVFNRAFLRTVFPGDTMALETLPEKIHIHDVIDTIITVLDARDPYTYSHSIRVAEISEIIARRMGFPDGIVERAHHAAHLHDIGKIGVSDGVLNKPGKLLHSEMLEIQAHSRIGYNILVRSKLFSDIAAIVLHHHERYDGLGYPDGLSGEDIPVESRIIAVADAFDALTSDRPYRKGIPFDIAGGEIQTHSGDHFCPEVVKAFIAGFQDICSSIPRIEHRTTAHFAFVGHEDLMHSRRQI
jgi:putative nucleotidyltransferase with HDIG domain